MNFQPSEEVLNCMNDIASSDFLRDVKLEALAYHIFYHVVYENKQNIAVACDELDIIRYKLCDLLNYYNSSTHMDITCCVAHVECIIQTIEHKIIFIKPSRDFQLLFNPNSKDLVISYSKFDVSNTCWNALDPDTSNQFIQL